MVTILEIPDELLLEIFKHLNPQSSDSTQLVCKKWLKLFNDHQLWKHFHRKYIGGRIRTDKFQSVNENLIRTYFYFVFQKLKDIVTFEKKAEYLIKNDHYKLFSKLMEENKYFEHFLANDEDHIQTILQLQSFFHSTAKFGSFHTMTLLISYQQKFHLPNFSTQYDSAGYLPIHYAACCGYDELLDLLVGQSGSPIDELSSFLSQNMDDISPLHLACQNGHLNIVIKLIGYKSDANKISAKLKETPLHYAAKYGHKLCAEYLVIYGNADVNILSSFNLKAYQYAYHSGYYSLSHFLLNSENYMKNSKIELAPKSLSTKNSIIKSIGSSHQTQYILHHYLNSLIESNRAIILPFFSDKQDHPPTLDLNRIFLSLQIDATASFERSQFYDKLEKNINDIEKKTGKRLRPDERYDAILSLLVNSPFLHSISQSKNITLCEIFQNERALVIMGDPGGGKTTLSRWIALQLARSFANGEERVKVPLSTVTSDIARSKINPMVDLGPTRLPIFLRISDFAEYVETCIKENKKQINLIDFLGFHPSFHQYSHSNFSNDPNEKQKLSAQLNHLIRKALIENNAVIVLDGLDEIAFHRSIVVQSVDKFIEEWIYQKNREKDYQSEFARPVDVGGNQIIITTRIAGYHNEPLRCMLTHVTIQPMNANNILNFCINWVKGINKYENTKKDKEEILFQGKSLAEICLTSKYVKQLAQNPLLLTILSLVYHREKTIPGGSAELYHSSIDILFNTWRDSNFTKAEIYSFLSPLAYFLHKNRSTGIISKKELIDFIKKLKPDVNASNLIKFTQLVEDRVGILVAKGDSIFGFLHQSFQEYFVACYFLKVQLNQNPNKSIIKSISSTIVKYLGKSRWREPVLLSLSIININWLLPQKERFYTTFLSKELVLKSLFPKASLTIITSLQGAILPEKTVHQILQLFVFSCIKLRKLSMDSFDFVLNQIYNSIKELKQNHNEVIVDSFLKILDENYLIIDDSLEAPNINDLFCCVADISLQLLFFDPRLCGKLQQGIVAYRDQSSWDWVINKFCRIAVSSFLHKSLSQEPVNFNTYPNLQPLTPLQKNSLNEKLKKLLLIRKLLIAALCGGYQDLGVVHSTTKYYQSIYFPNENTSQKNLAALFEGNVKDNWRIMPEFSEERIYRSSFLFDQILVKVANLTYIPSNYSGEACSFQQISSSIIEKLEPLLKEKLSSKARKFIQSFRIKSSPNRPDSTNIIRSGSVNSFPNEDHEEIIITDSNILKSELYNTEIIDALLAIGYMDESKLKDFILGGGAESCVESFRRISISVQDPAIRSRFYIYKSLQILIEKTPALHFEQILFTICQSLTNACEFLDVSVILGTKHKQINQRVLETIPLIKYTKSRRLKAIILGIYVLERIVSFVTENKQHSSVLSAESLLEMKEVNYNIISETLSLLPLIYRRILNSSKQMKLLEPWPFSECYCLPLWNKNDDEVIPIESLTTIETIPSEWWKVFAIRAMIAIALKTKESHELIPEILVVQLFCVQSESFQLYEQFLQIPESESSKSSSKQPVEYLIQAINVLQNPYYKARALWRLCRFIFYNRDKFIHVAIETAKLISHVPRKAIILEKLMEIATDKAIGLQLLNEITELSGKIIDPNNQARLYARLASSSFTTPKQSIQFINRAIKCAPNVPNAFKKSTLYIELWEIINKNPYFAKCMIKWNRNVNKQQNNLWTYYYSKQLSGLCLLQLLNKISESTHDIFIPLTLYSIFNDAYTIYSHLQYKSSNLWSELQDETNFAQVYKILCKRAESKDSFGLVLDMNATVVIDQLITMKKIGTKVHVDGKEESVFDLLAKLLANVSDSSPDALSYFNSWIEVKHSDIQRQASLLLAEHAYITRETVPFLVDLLQMGDDRSKLRVQFALHGKNCDTTNSNRRLRTSLLQKDTLDYLSEIAWNSLLNKKLIISQTISWMGHDMIHDDPSVMIYYAGKIDSATNYEQYYKASFWIVLCECVTKDVWKIMAETLSQGSFSMNTRHCFLISAAKAAHSSTMCIGNWPEDAFDDLVKCKIDKETISSLTNFQDWPVCIANASLKALQLPCDSNLQLYQVAEKILEEDRKSFSIANFLSSKESFIQFGESFFHKVDTLSTSDQIFESCIPIAAGLLSQNPEIMTSILLPWLEESLQSNNYKQKLIQNSYYDYSFDRKENSLLQLASAISNQFPQTFQNYSSKKLSELLIDAVQSHTNSIGRIAALQLLCLYGPSCSAYIGIKSALLDVSNVKDFTILLCSKFRDLDKEALTILINDMSQVTTPDLILSIAKILSSVYLNNTTSEEHKSKILKCFSKSVTQKYANIPLYNISNISNQSSNLLIRCIGFLDSALCYEFAKISGI